MTPSKCLTFEIVETAVPPAQLNAFIGPYAHLKTGEEMPRCETCERRLSPLLEIRLERSLDLLVPGTPAGLLQVFHCANEKCEEFHAMDDLTVDNYLVRLLPDAEIGALTEGRHAPTFVTREIKPLKFYREANDDEALSDDKLGGIPAWVQDEAFPPCRHCRNPKHMQFVMQITPGEVEGFPFPDGAVLFVSQCRRHPEEFGLVWQCT